MAFLFDRVLLDYSFDLLLWCIYRPSQLGESEVQLCDAETRVKTLQVNTGIRDFVLEVGPFKVTVSDLLATLPPGTLLKRKLKTHFQKQVIKCPFLPCMFQSD